jgi:hypothetical protein
VTNWFVYERKAGQLYRKDGGKELKDDQGRDIRCRWQGVFTADEISVVGCEILASFKYTVFPFTWSNSQWRDLA